MILEKDAKAMYSNILKMYKNKELAMYCINKDENCIDLAIYDDFRKDDKMGIYLATNNFRDTSISKPNLKDIELDKIQKWLEKDGIQKNKLYEYYLNETIHKIGDVVKYENSDYGMIIDIDNNSNYPYAVVFPDIYKEDRPFWTADDEIEYVNDKEKTSEVKSWYQDNKKQIEKDIKNCNEMECDM